MALISQFRAVSADRSSVHKPVTCGWRIVRVDGSVLLQLDTYGSDDREIPDKVSQSIQLDRAAAQELMGLIRQAFPGL
jgi:hypothetical protein